MSHTISGTIFSLPGTAKSPVKAANLGIAWSGTSAGNTVTDGDGNYSIPGLADGTYTITPARSFPTSQVVVVAGADMPNINFGLAGPFLGTVASISGTGRGQIYLNATTVVDFSITDARGDVSGFVPGASVRFDLVQMLPPGQSQNPDGTVPTRAVGTAIFISAA
jgi:hypothetical protein